VWVALGGRHLALVLVGAALAVVMCGCVAAFIRSLVRHRRQAKEQNATARDVPVMTREMSALVLEEPTAPRAPETSGLADVAVDIAVQESDGRASRDDGDPVRSAASNPSVDLAQPISPAVPLAYPLGRSGLWDGPSSEDSPSDDDEAAALPAAASLEAATQQRTHLSLEV